MDGGDTPEVRSPEKILLQTTQGTPQAPISPYQERRGTSNSINNTNTRNAGSKFALSPKDKLSKREIKK